VERNDRLWRRALGEVVCLVGLVELVMWVVPFVRRPGPAFLGLVALVVALLVCCQIRDRVPARELGFRTDTFVAALRAYAVPFTVALVLLVGLGAAFGTLRFGERFARMLVFVPCWALVQQYMLLSFAQRRFRLVFGPGLPSALAASATFALLHLPNPTLTAACAVAGLVWTVGFERFPNLWANVVTHTLASAVLANSLPPFLLRNMVVGYNYFLR
jgi:hypothetical protein